MEIAIAFFLCLIPTVFLYVWLKTLDKDKPGYSEGCRKAMKAGFVSTGLVILGSFTTSLLGSLLGLKKAGDIIWAAYKNIIVFALVEEMCKFHFFRKFLDKTDDGYSWLDVTVFMTLVGTGFGLLESIVYSFSMNMGQAIVRGVSLGHSVYGFIMGYYYGKGLYTGEKRYFAASFMIPFLLHAAYDFSLSEEVTAINDALAIIPVTLALIEFVLLIRMIVFYIKRKKRPELSVPLRSDSGGETA